MLNEKGSIFVRCDYNGNWIVRPIMNEIFGEENFRNEITIAKSKEFFKTMTHIAKFSEETESLFFFSKTDKLKFNLIYKEKEAPSKYEPFLPVSDKTYRDSRIINGEKYYSPLGRKWGVKQENIDEFLREGRLKLENGKWYLYTFEEPLKDVWIDHQGYSRNWDFATENSEVFVKRAVQSTSNEGDLVMDFFLGSGTTTAVAHKLKRKWIGIEMGEHFYHFKTDKGPSGIVVRMKEVLAGRGNHEPCGISKEIGWQGGGFFKYYELEQYEEALANCKYEDSDLFNTPGKSPYQEYIFLKDEKMLRALEIDYENNKVKVDLSKLYPDIDIAETLSNLTGKWIKKIRDGEVEFEDGTRINIKDLDYKLIKPLIWWE
jgi:adenine specific DNA methylase Mod